MEIFTEQENTQSDSLVYGALIHFLKGKVNDS